MWRLFLFVVLFSFPAGLEAQQTKIKNYEQARRLFYKELYPRGGWTLYCNFHFLSKRGLNVEHVYAASWMGKHLQCGTRDNCRKTNQDFNYMEADLHNLFPALAEINQARSNLEFGIIPGEKREFGKCDFEVDRKLKLAEPRPAARGEISRAVLYMYSTYKLSLDVRLLGLLLEWDDSDPPGEHERWRNRIIERVQGTKNLFIDRKR